MYPYSDYKTDSQHSWGEPYGSVTGQGFSPESVHSSYNLGTPDSTDSYSAYPQNNYFSNNQFSADQQAPNYFQQQPGGTYYQPESYYQANPNTLGQYNDQAIQSSQYYGGGMVQQQYNYCNYQNSSSWQQQQQQQQHQNVYPCGQHAFVKSGSLNPVVKTETKALETSGCVENIVNGENGFCFNGFQGNLQTPEVSTNADQVGPNPGRLPSMPQFGFQSSGTNFKVERNHQTAPNFEFEENVKQEPKVSQKKITDQLKERKKSRAATKRMLNRFNGMTEEEVAKRGLPDYLKEGLDVVFIGINPSLFAAFSGKYYDGPGNHFWQALHMSGLLPHPMSPEDDHRLLDYGMGFTNIVARTTRGLSDLSRAEIADGAKILREKLLKYKPKIAVFNGKAIYEVYSNQKKFMFGRQPEPMISETGERTWLWVMPSTSARCAQLPRAVDKVPFFEALRKFRDYLTGRLPDLELSDVTFANVSNRSHNPAEGQMQTRTQHEEICRPKKICDRSIADEKEVDYSTLEPSNDTTPAKVPPSVGAVIDYVVQKYSDSPPGGIPYPQQSKTKSEESEQLSTQT